MSTDNHEVLLAFETHFGFTGPFDDEEGRKIIGRSVDRQLERVVRKMWVYQERKDSQNLEPVIKNLGDMLSAAEGMGFEKEASSWKRYLPQAVS